MPDNDASANPDADKTLKDLGDQLALQMPELNTAGRLNDYNPANVPNDAATINYLQQFGGQPAPTEPSPQAPRPEPSPAPAASPAPPQNGGQLLAGKYRTQEDLVRGYLAAQDELQKRNTENVALRTANQHLEQVFAPFRVRQDRPEPTPPIPVQFDQAGNAVVPPDKLRELIRQEAESIAQQTVGRALEPLSRAANATSRLRAEYPDYQQNEGVFSQWVAQNPTVGQRISQDPDLGLEYAYLKFSREAQAQQAAQQTQTAAAGQHQVDEARRQVTATTGGTPQNRRVPQPNEAQLRVREAYKIALETGDTKELVKARLEEALEAGSPGLLGSMENTRWGR